MRLAWYAACNPGKEDMFANVLEARNYAWRKAREASKRYGKKNITEFVMGLIRLNMEEKSGIGAGWNSLESLVISLLENK
jgi:DNA polymerase-3 subunit delta